MLNLQCHYLLRGPPHPHIRDYRIICKLLGQAHKTLFLLAPPHLLSSSFPTPLCLVGLQDHKLLVVSPHEWWCFSSLPRLFLYLDCSSPGSSSTWLTPSHPLRLSLAISFQCCVCVSGKFSLKPYKLHLEDPILASTPHYIYLIDYSDLFLHLSSQPEC